jgi:hypothetical protein
MCDPKNPEPRRTSKPNWRICFRSSSVWCRLPGPALITPQKPDRALRLEEAASLLAMSNDFVYRNWKRLGGYKDADHHIKFRMSDIQRHLQRKAKEGRP